VEGEEKLSSALDAHLPDKVYPRIDNFEIRQVIFRCRKHCPACQKKQCLLSDEHCDTFCPECADLVGETAVMIYLICPICGRPGSMPVRGKVIPDIVNNKVVCFFCNPKGGDGPILTLPGGKTTIGIPIWEETLSTKS